LARPFPGGSGYGFVVTVLAVPALRETLPRAHRLPMDPRSLVRRLPAASHRSFVRRFGHSAWALIGGLIVPGVFAAATSSSYLLNEPMGWTPRATAWLSPATRSASWWGTGSAARILRRRDAGTLLMFTLTTLSTTAGFAVIPASSGGVAAISVSTMLFMLGAGLSVFR
jgi:hypothetical protein